MSATSQKIHLMHKYEKFKRFIYIYGFFCAIVLFVFAAMKLDSTFVLFLAIGPLSIYYLTTFLFILSERKQPQLLKINMLDLIFNAILVFSLFIGFSLPSSPILVNLFGRGLWIVIIVLLSVYTILIWVLKKLFVHIPLEYKMLRFHLQKEKNKESSIMTLLYNPLFLQLAFVFFIALTLINPTKWAQSNVQILVISFIMPMMIFLVSTYIDLMDPSISVFFLRLVVHVLDAAMLFFLILGIKLVTPHPTLNASLSAPLLITFVILFLTDQIRERLLAMKIQRVKEN
jgi:hypothetical protein